MIFKSDPTGQVQVSSHLRPNTDPVIRPDIHRRTSKRASDRTLNRASKRSRTSQGPSKQGSKTSWSSSPSTSASFDSVTTGSSNTDGALLSGTSNSPVISTSGDNNRGRGSKRKSEETKGPQKRSRRSSSPSEPRRHQASSEKPGTPWADISDSRAAFESMYTEDKVLGEGGFGCVFAGYRRDNNLPVAIKHISKEHKIKRTTVLMNRRHTEVPLEVALMLQVNPTASSSSAAVGLLDWFDLEDELILVLERPAPCMDLESYIFEHPDMQERQAKKIAKQLVEALIDIHSRGVFHNDIKLENVIIETGLDVPRVRIIDFGCGRFLSEDPYTTFQGTLLYTPPEWFLDCCYKAEPATVWQLGVLLYGMMHHRFPFNTELEITEVGLNFSLRQLSFNCKHFLMSCLDKNPETRASLETLRNHLWLI